MSVFGDRAFTEAFKIKQDQMGRPSSNMTDVLKRIQTAHRSRDDHSVRRQPSASQKERPEKKTLMTPSP